MKMPSKTKHDPFVKLKYIAYCRAFNPPEDQTLADFVAFARTFLSLKNQVLFKSPIWDSYSDEDILVEYFVHVFKDSLSAKETFENLLEIQTDASGYEDFAAFANAQIGKAKEPPPEESIHYTPENQ